MPGLDGVHLEDAEVAQLQAALPGQDGDDGVQRCLHDLLGHDLVNAGPLAFGSVQETIAVCRTTLETMLPGGGYCFAPTHALQDNSPTKNVLAMYETAHKYGRY